MVIRTSITRLQSLVRPGSSTSSSPVRTAISLSRRCISKPATSASHPVRLPRLLSTPLMPQRTLHTSGRALVAFPSAPESSSKTMSQEEYERISDEDMDVLHESLEVLCEDCGGGLWEVEYSSGVLTLNLPPYGTYVINKQPPNQQIWLSSPISGPQRFSYSDDGEWIHHRKEGVTLGKLLDEEIKRCLGESARGGEVWEGVGLK